MPDAQRAEIAKLEALHAGNPQGRIFTHLAEAYRKAGDLERARDVLAEGIERHPDYSSAHVVLARVLADMGEEDGAAEEFRRVLELDSHNLVALRSLGDLARSAGRTDEAVDYYTRLLDVEPSDDRVRNVLEEIERDDTAAPTPTGAIDAPTGESGWGPDDDAPATEGDEDAAWAVEDADAAPGRTNADRGEPWPPASESAAAAPVADEDQDRAPDHADSMPAPPDADEGAPWVLGDEDADAGAGVAETADAETVEYGTAEDATAEDAQAETPEYAETGTAEYAEAEPAEDAEYAEYAENRDSVLSAEFGETTETPEATEPREASETPEPTEPELAEPEPAEIAGAEVFDEPTWRGAAAEGEELRQPSPEPDEPGVMTETIAQVYARQGLYDRAAEVYRQLVRGRPDDAALRARLEEMEALAAAPQPGTGDVEPEAAVDDVAPLPGLVGSELGSPPPVEPLPGLESDEVDPVTGLRTGEGPGPAMEQLPEESVEDSPPPPEEESPWAAGTTHEEPSWTTAESVEEDALAQDEAGADEAWSAAVSYPWTEPAPAEEPDEPPPAADEQDVDEELVESVWTGAGGVSDSDESPYAWAGETEPEPGSDESEPIASYLRSLLGWGGTRGGRGETPTPAEQPEGATGQQGGALPADAPEAASRAEADAAPADRPDAGSADRPEAAPGDRPDAAPADRPDAASAERPGGGSPGKGPSDDDDLDTFRSWLESLKQ